MQFVEHGNATDIGRQCRVLNEAKLLVLGEQGVPGGITGGVGLLRKGAVEFHKVVFCAGWG